MSMNGGINQMTNIHFSHSIEIWYVAMLTISQINFYLNILGSSVVMCNYIPYIAFIHGEKVLLFHIFTFIC